MFSTGEEIDRLVEGVGRSSGKARAPTSLAYSRARPMMLAGSRPAPAIPRSVLVESIVTAAAEGSPVHPSAARAGLAAAVVRAAELGVTLEEVAQLL